MAYSSDLYSKLLVSSCQTYMVVSLSVIADDHGVVSAVETAGEGHHIEVVELMVLAHPGSD